MLRCVFAPWLLVACSSSEPDTGTVDAAGEAPELDTLAVVVGPTNLDLGEVFVGERATGTFAVLNRGAAPLVVSVVVESQQRGAWSLSSAQATPQPGAYAEFSVTVEVTELVSYAGTVVVTDAWQRELGRVGLTVRTRVDADGDGFGADRYAGDDCNDDDPSVNPDALEIFYDGVDQDCDGASDFDADADGFDSAVYGGLDCDDSDARVFPDADDPPYDGIDQDCAGDSDADADADGFDSWQVGGLDCDDERASVSPAAGACWTGRVDAAARGVVLAGPLGSRPGAALLADPDLLGRGPGLLVGAPGAGLERGRAWWVAGPMTAGGDLDTAGVVLAEGSSGDRLGAAATVGRPDGGTQDAVLLGAPGHHEGDGGVLLVSADGTERWLEGDGGTGKTVAAGDLDGDGRDEVLASGAGSVLLFDASGSSTRLPGDPLQTALAAGDLDGDGYHDAVFGRPEHAASGRSAGAVLIGFGGPTGVALDGPDTVAFAAAGATDPVGVGAAVLLSDRNGDGQADLVAADTEGGVHSVVGPLSRGATLVLREANETWSVPDATHALVLVGGDADEDGQEDLLTGVPGLETTAVWLSGGGAWTDTGSLSVPLLDAPFEALSPLVDLNGDGHVDLALGNPNDGRVFVLQGPALGPRATEAREPTLPHVRELP